VPVSISSREVEDDDNAAAAAAAAAADDDLRPEHGVETYTKCNVAAKELVAMETDDIEKLEEQDDVSNRFFSDHFKQNVTYEQDMKSDVPVIRIGSAPVPSDNVGVIKAIDIDNISSNVGSDLTVKEGKEVESESAIIHEKVCANIKLEVDGIVSDSLRRQEEVVSVRVAKVDTDSEKFTCDGDETNIESVKMETSSSSNET
jgi:hypothetical protein